METNSEFVKNINKLNEEKPKETPKPKRKPNKWTQHVSEYRAANPSKSYKECLFEAKSTYKRR